MNKKLVIAALLAAAAAEGEEVVENADNANAENAENAENNEQAEQAEQAEEKAEEKAEGEEKEEKEEGGDGDKEDGDKDVRDAWKEVIGQDAQGKDIERVLCAGWGDEGEAALWDEAQDKFKDLQGKAGKAKEAVDAAKTQYDDLKKSYDDRKEAADNHREAGKAYLKAWTDADQAVKDLVEAGNGADETSAKAAKLKEFTDKTTLAEGAVDTQRERVEKILLAKRTQDGEVTLWGERVNSANDAVLTATSVKEAADAAVVTAKEQVSTRSWLFTMLGTMDVDLWAADCNSAKPCAYVEDTTVAQGDANLSTWAWPASCDYTTGANQNVVTHKCEVRGLSGPNAAGLAAANTAAKGVARVDANTPPTELYLALENADYTRVNSGDQLANADSSKVLIALAGYETWQKTQLLLETMKAGCWQLQGDGQTYSKHSWCATSNGIDTATDSVMFNPLMQGIGNAKSYVALAAGLAAAKGTPAFGEANSVAITNAQRKAKAVALIDLWFSDWRNAALATELAFVGDEANKANDWLTATEIGKAEATQTSKVTILAAANKNKAAAERWEALAQAEQQAADGDLTRAQALLVDLVADIAPRARAEAAAQLALTTAEEEQAARVVAQAALGDAAVAADVAQNIAAVPATGARAVLAAALATKESVEAQQAFHDAREQWALDNFTPVKEQYDDLVAVQGKLDLEVVAAEEAFDRAREACKVEGFERAQKAREEAAAVAAARIQKVKDTKAAYDALAAFPEDGSAGTLCHVPKVGADEPAQARTACLDGEPEKPLCCGAAQRFLKDGTKLSIETCQPADSTTYTYYPALPADAVVAPTPETWRFQCISAAQKLAAAATAALAAGYMMA